MVRITNSLYHEAYEYIKQDSAMGGNCIIFVASDVDSICAVHIFQALLRSDIIPHKIVPVSGMKDLEDANEKLVSKDENLRSIVMINCGGGIMISNLFTAHEDTKVYIIDSHRPLLLDSLLDDNNHICVFDDESDSHRMGTVLSAFEMVMAAEDEEDGDEDEEEEEEDEDGRPLNPRSRQRRRLNEALTPAQRTERRRARHTVMDYYNQGAFFANSVSGSVYELAQQLGKTSNDLLWLAIVGVTSQYVFERIDTMKYGEQVDIFRDDRARLNVDTESNEASQSNNVVIKSEDEYRFMMFRHWSLYDSMYHSGYISSKLAVWKDAGKKRLNNMFAKMGFSLQQCQQVYTHMDMDLKQMLRNKIEVVAPLYGLTDICFPSFTRSYGWESCLSASDVVYSLSTILETSPAAAVRLGIEIEHRHGNDDDWKPTHLSSDTTELRCGRRDWWMRNFYTAYDALKDTSPRIISQGLRLCMETQKAIVRQGTSVIDKRMVKLLKNFRFVNIRNTAELPVFQHPSSLTKLGLFLTDAYREHGKKNLPIVISSFDEEYNTCLVIALSGAPIFGEVRKNTFGLAFEEAVESTKARISFDSFDQTVIQVHNNDIEHFIESLHYKTR
ncbi:unnamed protein product [Mucor fragilis]